MIRHTSSIFFLTLCIAASGQTLTWESTGAQVITSEAPSASGLACVAVAENPEEVTAVFASPVGGEVKVSSFGASGAAYAEPLTTGVDQIPNGVRLSRLKGDTGYMMEYAGGSYSFWLTDYSAHQFSVSSIGPSPEQDNCAFTALDVVGQGGEIAYHGITGRRFVLSRDITISYTTQTYSEDAGEWVDAAASKQFEALSSVMRVEAPLATTAFTISGDRFLREWGRVEEISSVDVKPHAVDAFVDAEQATRESENEVVGSVGQLGGSAPCDVAFTAAVSEGAVFSEWQFSRSSEFEDISLRITDLRFDYSFTEEGTTYVRFVCADNDALCEWFSPPFEVSIGTSMLKCPNAFSPANQDGVNDVWKVTYSSIVVFECSIFTRSGHCILTFNDPSEGWDGRYGGKFVPSGVYFYVIKARGADGKKYNLSGDINIVNYK